MINFTISGSHMATNIETQWIAALSRDLVAIGAEPSKVSLCIAVAAILYERYIHGYKKTLAKDISDLTGRTKGDIGKALQYLEALDITEIRQTQRGMYGKPIRLTSRIIDSINHTRQL
jgi:hypothetical protein